MPPLQDAPDAATHAEFEAPMSADRASERFSIDLSLELEHQLEHMESPPSNRESLDPHVLAHIIMQLRHSLAEMTKERDEVVKALSSAFSKEAELNEAVQLLTDKATGREEELAEARKKLKEDEEAIIMLRSKVEESRRGLMRLQTESRRQSGNFESTRVAFLAGSPPGSKRASFAPLSLQAGRPNHGHRRISSVSDTGQVDPSGTSPRTQDFPSLDSPQPLEQPCAFELESLKKELQAVRDELDNTKHELAESNEAREASETCAKALRDFIAENDIGVREIDGGPSAIKLPPPPATTTGEEAETHKTTSSVGWGFGKLWKVDHSARTPSVASVASVASSVVAAAPQTPQVVSAPTPTPLTRKFGSFFSSRSSTSSSGGCTPHFQSNAALTSTSHRGSIHSFSDASSITEPVSPPNEQNGAAAMASMELSEALGELDISQGAGTKDVQVRDEGPTVIVR
ncbi:hypothetical protein APHAL10511_002178 [Amanita phalloides]|nr:hypothetical protein APHAL10511_002178 [Amanita phalloides]